MDGARRVWLRDFEGRKRVKETNPFWFGRQMWSWMDEERYRFPLIRYYCFDHHLLHVTWDIVFIHCFIFVYGSILFKKISIDEVNKIN
jgi:hypothetical protein